VDARKRLNRRLSLVGAGEDPVGEKKMKHPEAGVLNARRARGRKRKNGILGEGRTENLDKESFFKRYQEKKRIGEENA